MQSSNPSSSLRNPEVWVPLFALAIRFVFLLYFSTTPFFEPIKGGNDRALYDGFAQQVMKGNWFPPGVFEYMPLYPWVLGLIFRVAGPNLFAAGMFGVMLDTITTLLVIRLARRLGASHRGGALAGLLYALYPVAIIYSPMTMANTLNAFLVISFTHCMIHLEQQTGKSPGSPPWISWFGTGLLAGITALSFAGMFLMVLFSLVFLWIKYRKEILKLLLPSLLLGLGMFLPILPVTLHNGRVEKGFVLVTAHGGFNFYMGNHAQATGYPVQIGNFRGDAGSLLFDARVEAEQKEGRHLTAAEFSAHWSRRAWEFICTEPVAVGKLYLLKILRFWSHAEYDDMRLLGLLSWRNPVWSFLLHHGFLMMGAAGLVGLVLHRGNSVARIIFLAGMTGLILFFITSRYRLTLVPLLCAFAPFAFSLLQESRKTLPLMRSKAGIIIGALVLTMAPLPHSDFRALDCYNAAAYLMACDRPSEALEAARQGIKIAPQEGKLFFVAGNALNAQGHTLEAAQAYQQAIIRSPRDAGAHYNLAFMLMKLDRSEAALREAELSIMLDPHHPLAGSLVAELREKLLSSDKKREKP